MLKVIIEMHQREAVFIKANVAAEQEPAWSRAVPTTNEEDWEAENHDYVH